MRLFIFFLVQLLYSMYVYISACTNCQNLGLPSSTISPGYQIFHSLSEIQPQYS